MRKLIVCLLVMVGFTAIAQQYRNKTVVLPHDTGGEKNFSLLYGILPYPLSIVLQTQRNGFIQRHYPLSEACACVACQKSMIFDILWGSTITPPKKFLKEHGVVLRGQNDAV